MSITQLPPKPATLEKAKKYIATKRAEINQNRDRREQMWGGMMEAISTSMEDLGVNSLVMGNAHIAIGDPPPHDRGIESRWTQSLNEGRFVGVIQAGNLCASYYDKEKVDMEARTIDELIDQEIIRQIAPDAVIYGPGMVSPWPDRIGNPGFAIWTDDRPQFERLWAGLKDWVKTKWHDDTMRDCKFPRKAKDVFHCIGYHDIAPDLSWREAQLTRATTLREQGEVMGGWDALAQCEIKKIIGSLIQLEEHPLIGHVVPEWLERLTPMLAQSMEGKSRQKNLVDSENSARIRVYEGVKSFSVGWDDWTPSSPLPPLTRTPTLPCRTKSRR